MPREGFEPSMFLSRFSNLYEQDFDGVQASLGIYEYKNSQLSYKPIGSQTHSAAKAITEEGFETLLNNLADRFNIQVINKQSIKIIIDHLYEEFSNNNGIHFRTISKDDYNLLTVKTEKVIKSQGAWVNFWSSISPTDGPIPQIDFNEKMVIAILMGQKSTGSYKTEIIKIIEKENEIEVIVKEVSPGSNCGADAVITSPYHIIELKKSDKQVRFTFKQEVIQCNN